MKIDLQRLIQGDRRSLARAITLIESEAADDRDAAAKLVVELLPHAGRSLRLGISGAPGVGKSTFIDALGMHLIELGHQIAVLAIDPSSPTSGGSILGDKFRMQRLSAASAAYVRPSPAGTQLGGVASRTRDAILCCEAAGFDIVIVETVGVGQSEVSVAAMVDLFLILLQPASGDEVQGIKRGILDLVDMAVVNKADGELIDAAERTAEQFRSAFAISQADASPCHVQTCSALLGTGISNVWTHLNGEATVRKSSGAFEQKRLLQRLQALDELFQSSLREELRRSVAFQKMRRSLGKQVARGEIPPSTAATKLATAVRFAMDNAVAGEHLNAPNSDSRFDRTSN